LVFGFWFLIFRFSLESRAFPALLAILSLLARLVIETEKAGAGP